MDEKIEFKRIVNILKNRTKKPEDYQRWISIPMNITRQLNIQKGDTIHINVLNVEKTSKMSGGTARDISDVNALREKYRSPSFKGWING